MAKYVCQRKCLWVAVAEEIGVYAEPEVEIWQITAANPFLVIASDGVFEFLSDQDVVNMVRSLKSS